MNKMKKVFILFSFIAVFLFSASQLFAVVVSTSTKFRARAVISEPELTIVHTPITKVSPVAKEMVVVGSIDVGSSPNYLSELKLVYTLPGSSETTENISFSSNLGNVIFSKRIVFPQESGQIEYKITATAVKGVSISTETSKCYAVISGSVTANIGSSGGTITLESGNQLYGNTKLVCGSGVLSSPTDIVITEVDISQAVSVFSSSKATAQEMMLTCFDVTPSGTILSDSAVLTLYYGSQTTSQKIVVKRFDGSQWIDVDSGISGSSSKSSSSKAPVVNSSSRTVSVEITELGRYAAFAGSGSLPDSVYRPVKKVVVFGRGQVEFNNLMDGDVIKIFNINGKKIREITSGDASGFKWDGKKDDGSYAESGAYIYQIRLAENGKLISGTIAFVR